MRRVKISTIGESFPSSDPLPRLSEPLRQTSHTVIDSSAHDRRPGPTETPLQSGPTDSTRLQYDPGPTRPDPDSTPAGPDCKLRTMSAVLWTAAGLHCSDAVTCGLWRGSHGPPNLRYRRRQRSLYGGSSRIGDSVHLPRMRPIPVCENVSGSGASHVLAETGHFGVSVAFRSGDGSQFLCFGQSGRYHGLHRPGRGRRAPLGSPGAQPSGQMTPRALFHTPFVIYRASSWGRKGSRHRNRRRIRRGARTGSVGFHVGLYGGAPSDPGQVTLEGTPRQAVTVTLSRRSGSSPNDVTCQTPECAQTSQKVYEVRG